MKQIVHQMRKVLSFPCSCLLLLFCIGLLGCNTDYSQKIDTAIQEHDFQNAHNLLQEIKMQSKQVALWDRAEARQFYLSEYNKVILAEITYLVNEKDEQASDRLIGLINEYPIDSNPATGTTHDSDIIEGNDKYNAEVGKFNDYCNQILSRAISTKNLYLAEAIVNNFKPTLERKKIDSHFLGNDEYDYQYVETDKEKAKIKLKEAIMEGKFNYQD